MTYRIRTICGLDTTAIEEEPDRIWCLALSLTESIHELLQGCGALDFEEHLVVIVGDFDIQVLAGWGALWLLRRSRTSILI